MILKRLQDKQAAAKQMESSPKESFATEKKVITPSAQYSSIINSIRSTLHI
jgi:hypothetical protein